MPSAQKPAGAEDAERALSRDQPVAADAAAPTPANQGSASAAGAEFTDEDLQQDPLGNGDLLEQTHRSGCNLMQIDRAGETVLFPPTLPRRKLRIVTEV